MGGERIEGMSVSNHSKFDPPIQQLTQIEKAAGLLPILAVVDNPDLAHAIRLRFEAEGFAITVAQSGSGAIEAFPERPALAVVVERKANDTESRFAIEAMRAAQDWTPVVLFGGSPSVDERIEMIRAGADDYLPEMFDPRELVVRVEALVRRRFVEKGSKLRAGEIELDLVKRSVRCAGRSVELLPREFALLEYFARHPRQVLSRQKLLDELWGAKTHVKDNVVDVQVGNLRRKLDPTGERRFIVSVRGAGFRLEPDGLE